MRKMPIAALCATSALLAALVAMSADAQVRTRNIHDGRYRTYQNYQNDRSQYGGPSRSRPDPNSYDGRRTGQPRTCGHDFFIYDSQGVPTGPYCN